MNVFGKAKDAKDAVAQRASALKEHAGDLATGLKEHAGDTVASVAAAALERAQATLSELNATLPILKSAGYTLSDVQVEIGLSPKVQATFNTASALTDAEIEVIAAEHTEKKLAVTLLRALVGASRLQSRVTIGDLKPVGIDVQIGLSPAVVVKFS
jgi:hypothetical protein